MKVTFLTLFNSPVKNTRIGIYEPSHKKTDNIHGQKQRRRSAVQ